MKKSVFKSGLVAAIAVVMMSCTTTANAQTGNTKYIYGQDDTNTTVYTLNEGAFLDVPFGIVEFGFIRSGSYCK